MLAKTSSEKKEAKRQKNSPFTNSKSTETKLLERQYNQGFQEFKSLESLNNYYSKDPDSRKSLEEFEPPAYRNKPTEKDRAISRGD